MEMLKEEIQRRFGLTEDFGLQYRDVEFGNEFMNLTTTADIKDKSTIKVINTQNSVPATVPAATTETSSLLDDYLCQTLTSSPLQVLVSPPYHLHLHFFACRNSLYTFQYQSLALMCSSS